MTDLTLVELFAGIGGFSAGFDRAGVRTVAAVEIDPAARRIFSRHFPDAALFDDVTKVGGDELRAVGFVPERGIITGGWPCQDLSRAGEQAGISASRSGLFYEAARIIDECKPRWFVLENVPRLLTINRGRDMGSVIGTLVECGYGVAYRVLDSQYFGVAQKRRRLFFVGSLGDNGNLASEILFDPESLRGASQESEASGQGDTQEVETSDGSGGWTALKVSTLQGGGRRGYRIDAEGVAGGQLIVCPTINPG